MAAVQGPGGDVLQAVSGSCCFTFAQLVSVYEEDMKDMKCVALVLDS